MKQYERRRRHILDIPHRKILRITTHNHRRTNPLLHHHKHRRFRSIHRLLRLPKHYSLNMRLIPAASQTTRINSLPSLNHNPTIRNQHSNHTQRRQPRSQNRTNNAHSHGNLKQHPSPIILHNYPSNISLMKQLPDPINKITGRNTKFFPSNLSNWRTANRTKLIILLQRSTTPSTINQTISPHFARLQHT